MFSMNQGKSPVVCLFPDLLGTGENSRHRRGVGVSCPAIFRTLITVCKPFSEDVLRKWPSLRIRKVKRPVYLEP